MLRGFKDFVMRGNLIELAVAFIVGAAFATVVKTFTDVVMGFIGKAGGQPDFSKVTLAGVNVGLFIIAEGRLYMEPVEEDDEDIDAAVQQLYKPPASPSP